MTEWLNYHHLYYFWTVVREGGISKASRRLGLTQPTVSGQLRTLEESLGQKLYVRSGKELVLTEAGQTAYRYAEEIFTLGREFQEVVKGRGTPAGSRVAVGIAEVVPKLVAFRLLEPLLHMPNRPRLHVVEDIPERLLAELALHRLDIVLTDVPMHPGVKVRAYHHLLGECGVTFLAAPTLAARLATGFPSSLSGAPMLLPAEPSALRRGLELWFDGQGVVPDIVAELDDSALAKTFAQAGAGVVAAPRAIEEDVRRQYGLEVVGRTDAVRERYYAITTERRIRHPALVEVAKAAPGILGG